MTKKWLTSLSSDHQIKLDGLNHNFLIHQQGAAWIHCPGRGPDVPRLKALYLPLKYHQPVICNFRQRHPDVPVKDQMQKLQESYCWLGMTEDIPKHSATCNNCQILQQAKKAPQIPMPRSISTFTGHSSLTPKTNSLSPSPTKPPKLPVADSLAYNIFTHWICRMAVPQVIDSNLDEQHADELKAELDNYLQQEAPHNPFIDVNRGSCYNQKAADLISKTISKAQLS